jgi:hypothetical protein
MQHLHVPQFLPPLHRLDQFAIERVRRVTLLLRPGGPLAEFVGRHQVEEVDVAIGEVPVPRRRAAARYHDQPRAIESLLHQPVEERNPVEDFEPDLPRPRTGDHVARRLEDAQGLLERDLVGHFLGALPAGAAERFNGELALLLHQAAQRRHLSRQRLEAPVGVGEIRRWRRRHRHGDRPHEPAKPIAQAHASIEAPTTPGCGESICVNAAARSPNAIPSTSRSLVSRTT